MIYTVHDYDHITYAGTSLDEAAKHVCGAGVIEVWVDGKMTNTLKFSFKEKSWV